SGVSLAILLAACGNDKSTTTNPSTNDGPDASGGPAEPDIRINPAANDPRFTSPFDATPDPDGKTVYFTARTADGPAVFRAAAGGGELTRLFAGDPLVSPFSIAISDDGTQLFIADAAAENDTEERGASFTLPVSGGAPQIVAGTAGPAPRGVEVMGDAVYFSGAKDGVPAVFKMAPSGNPAPIASGDPLRDPSGIAISKSGRVYVLDSAGAASGL